MQKKEFFTKGKKILLVSKYDYAGSGYRMAEAVNLTTNNAVEYVVLYPYFFPRHLKRRPSLYKLGENNQYVISREDSERIQIFIDDADIIHFKGDDLPSQNFFGDTIQIPDKKTTIVTVSGSHFRRGDSPVACPIFPIEAYVQCSDFRTAMTPDLNYPEFKGIYTQQALDSTSCLLTWKKREIPVFAHSPSDHTRKGTELFFKITQILRHLGYSLEIDLIHNVSHRESLERKKNATIFFDQVNDCGFYGNSALEAMAFGIPTVSYMSDVAIKQSDGKINDSCPVINCGNTPESLLNTFESLLKQDMTELSRKTKAWCDHFHSYETVGRLWGNIYDQLT